MSSDAPLDANAIEAGLQTRRVGKHVLCFGQLSSTCDTAYDAVATSGRAADGLAVFAESQTAGRGRRGRKWHSPSGANLLCSVALAAEPRPAPTVWTVAAGLAVAEAVERSLGLNCQVKWPNDVYLDGCKLAGVLTENRQSPAGPVLVVGVGINVNAAPPAELVDHPAISLAAAAGAGAVSRLPLARALLRRLDAWLADLSDDLPAASCRLRNAFTARCYLTGRQVTLATAAGQVAGIVTALDPLGSFELRQADGRAVALQAAEVTLKAVDADTGAEDSQASDNAFD